MVVTFASLTLWGCATVPAKNYQFENSRAYSNKTYDQVWNGVIEFMTVNNIPIKTIEKDSGVIYSEIDNFSKPSFSSITSEAVCHVIVICLPLTVFMPLPYLLIKESFNSSY